MAAMCSIAAGTKAAGPWGFEAESVCLARWSSLVSLVRCSSSSLTTVADWQRRKFLASGCLMLLWSGFANYPGKQPQLRASIERVDFGKWTQRLRLQGGRADCGVKWTCQEHIFIRILDIQICNSHGLSTVVLPICDRFSAELFWTDDQITCLGASAKKVRLPFLCGHSLAAVVKTSNIPT